MNRLLAFLRRSRRMAHAAQSDGIGGAYVNASLVKFGKKLPANNVRNKYKNRFGLRVLLILLGKEIFKKRNLPQPRYTSQRLRLGIFQHSSEQVCFALP